MSPGQCKNMVAVWHELHGFEHVSLHVVYPWGVGSGTPCRYQSPPMFRTADVTLTKGCKLPKLVKLQGARQMRLLQGL